MINTINEIDDQREVHFIYQKCGFNCDTYYLIK